MANKMERFTQRARRVLSLAQEEAERLQHEYIGTEHLLLGLIREGQGVASRVLGDLSVEYARTEELVKQMTRSKTRAEGESLDLSPGTKRVLELTVDEARRMGHFYIGTEHLLLGLVRQPEGVAIDVLKRLGVSPDEVRRQTRRVLQEAPAQPTPPSAETEPPMDMFASLSFRVKSYVLTKLLAQLATEEPRQSDMRALIEQFFSEVLSEQLIVLTEDQRKRLLDSILAPFKPVDESKRFAHLVISDKTSGEIYADIKLPLAHVREGMQAFMKAMNEGRMGKLIDINDAENNNIVISIEDEQDTSAAAISHG